MVSIAVLGEDRNVLGFKPFGAEVYVYQVGKESIDEWFQAIVKKGYKLIVVTEAIAAKVKEQIDELWRKEVPVILTIRGLGETSRSSFERLRRLVIKAIGTDLFKES